MPVPYGGRGLARLRPFAIAGLVALVMVPGLAVAHGLTYVSGHGPTGVGLTPAGVVRAVHFQRYASGSTVALLTSNGSTALLDLILLNGSNEIVLYDAGTNSSHVVQAAVPGGAGLGLEGLHWAGTAFFLAWYNFTTASASFEEVTKTGTYSAVTMPVGNGTLWTIPGGDASGLFLAATGFLVVVNPRTLTLSANYSLLIPHRAAPTAVETDASGSSIYVAGTSVSRAGSDRPFFEIISVANSTGRVLSHGFATMPSSLSGVFASMAWAHGELYVSGYILRSNSTGLSTDGGYLYRYDPASGIFRNLSVVLPNSTWAVWSVEPWGKSVLLSLGGYVLPSFTVSGGEYQLSATGSTLTNRSSVFPTGFVADFLGITSRSGSFYFLGGYDQPSFSGEVVAVRL
ncbi:MAG TPA: hypothetical protein VGV89_01205 [Thermoplasmata archaeon]|nr:hypothetical protein [Thermoplasmata archaeon]